MKNRLPLFVTIVITGGLMTSSPSLANQGGPGPWRGQSLAEFTADDPNAVEWEVVNDGVMGGISKGNFSVSDKGILNFSGTLSLENNGGFSSIRSERIDRNLSNDLGILLKVKGDGRTYSIRLESSATYRGMPISFSGNFTPEAGKWQQIKIPFSDLKGGWRGMDLPDKQFDPSIVRKLGLLIGDKVSGPFNLEVEYIRTYGEGQSNFSERNPETPAEKQAAKARPNSGSVIDLVASDERFSTLKAALDAAKLTTFFQWDNKKTVFAPTNDAFAKLPKGTVESLLKPENKDRLVQILSYHVHPGDLNLAAALGSKNVETVEKSPIRVAFRDGAVKVNDSSLLEADIEATDGKIHVIDSVLLPKPKETNLLTTAQGAGSFKTLLAAAKEAGLVPALTGKDPLTVFAPTDEAFAALPEGTVEGLLKKENRKQLIELLTTHVVSGKVSAGDALNAKAVKSLSGSELEFAINNGLFTVNDSIIRSTGIDGGNGIIHVIDSVIGFANKASDYGSCPESDNEPSPETTSVGNQSAADVIAAAIEKGVPLYNSGKISECAELYENALLSLSEMENLDGRAREALGKVARAGKQYDHDRRAWFYRHALDETMRLILHSRG